VIDCTFIVILDEEGKHIGRKDKLFGAIGTNIMLLTPFRTTGPPADKA
jgi:hypothetical protein